MSEGYKQRTKILGIPVVGYKDKIVPEIEMVKWQMVENILLSSLRGKANILFEIGTFRIAETGDNEVSVRLIACGAKTSAKGLVGGMYFQSPPEVVWEGLKRGRKHVLYISGCIRTLKDPCCVSAVSHPYSVKRDALLMVGILDYSGEQPVLDPKPVGQVHIDDLVGHVTQGNNPHGKILVQEGIKVDSLSVQRDIEVGGRTYPASDLQRVLSGTGASQVVDFEGNGSDGVIVETERPVSFVVVSRKTGVDGKCDNIRVGYMGSDKRVERPNQFVVEYDGDMGIPLRALVVEV